MQKALLFLFVTALTSSHVTASFYGKCVLYHSSKELISYCESRYTNNHINDPNRFGHTPLHLAVWSNKIDMVLVLLHYGADIRVINRYHQTPLHSAVYRHFRDVLKILLAHIEKKYSVQEQKKILDFQDLHGNTALHLAILKGDYTSTELLVNAGADLLIKNEYGTTPITLAANTYKYTNHEVFEKISSLLEKAQKLEIKHDMNNICEQLWEQSPKTEWEQFPKIEWEQFGELPPLP